MKTFGGQRFANEDKSRRHCADRRPMAGEDLVSRTSPPPPLPTNPPFLAFQTLEASIEPLLNTPRLEGEGILFRLLTTLKLPKQPVL
ncbi:unnamed protein product [Bursaphelenchus xylophilus]|uniref:(pine wood nematode) hypothetical protein n=1 Tax=Bursaphelenchus xylophilus TaxID=6326 RepID=A0A1I7SMK8_BURXY|nr:unnamed protein product [Bursaphelenchus xylophilus]CAG9130267.1 unnamed protein product [Bursaphelenchus xylophilus]